MEGFAQTVKQHTDALLDRARRARAPAMADPNPAPSTCTHCAGPLSKHMETSRWTVSPLIRDSFSMIGSAVGGISSAFYGFNHAMPVVRRCVKGPMWIHFLVGGDSVGFQKIDLFPTEQAEKVNMEVTWSLTVGVTWSN